ncbi:hypothetical protein pVco7_gp124 [Vibrio phage pVco-7]
MLVKTILDDLKYGELSAHGIMLAGEISVQDKQRLIHHINIALTELYTRFPLLTKELTLIQKAGKTVYPLTKEHAITDITLAGYEDYIIDTPDAPFENDLTKVISIYDEMGNEIRLNDATADCVIFTPAYNVLEIPSPVDTNALFIIYQATHPKVIEETDKLDLPENFKPALLSYIAHRVYSGGTAQEHVNMANTMLQKYELFCTQQRQYGTDNSQEYDRNIKPCLGGWV